MGDDRDSTVTFNPLELPFASGESPAPFRSEAEPVQSSSPEPIPLTDWGIDSGVRKAEVALPPRPQPRFSARQLAEQRAQDAKERVTVTVRGIEGAKNGVYRFAYERGKSLGKYLDEVKLRYTAVRHAVYDQENLSKGRVRLAYVPGANARIFIGPASWGLQSRFQRKSVDDVEALANRMGGGRKIVDFSLDYGKPKGRRRPKKADVFDDLEQA